MVKEPEKEPFFMTVENTLKSLQTIVNGFIEVVPVSDRKAIICNGASRLTEKQSCVIDGSMYYGTVIWTGLNSAHLTKNLTGSSLMDDLFSYPKINDAM